MTAVGPMLIFLPLFWLLYSRGSQAASQSGDIILNLELMKNIKNVSTLLLDRSAGLLYLGAKDAILAMDTENLHQQPQKIVWGVSELEKSVCINKGLQEVYCHNYIRLLEFLGDGRIYVCGTYAFDPQCAYLVISSFTLGKKVDGKVKTEMAKGKFPYNPYFSFTSLSADGIIYAATATDFYGTKFVISRITGPQKEQISSETSTKWLYEPEFVSSAFIAQPPDNNPTGEDDNIFFFFTEIEGDSTHTKPRVSRVARICKSDVGGKLTLQQKWTTFLKAHLVCKDKANRYQYDIVKDVFTLQPTPGDPNSIYFYALFTSLGKPEAGTAVCVFSLSDINKVMDGPFKQLEQGCPGFTPPKVPTPRPGKCINNEARKAGYKTSSDIPSATHAYSRDHLLMKNSVTAHLLLLREDIVYTKLAVTPMKSRNGQRAAVLHLGTDQGELHRVSVEGQKTNLLQEIPLFSNQKPINNIVLYQKWTLVSSPLSLARINADACALITSCELCAETRGLGCVWSTTDKTCMATEEDPGEGDVVDAALKMCDNQNGRCNPAVTELNVPFGLQVLLPCLQLSPMPCSWELPAQRHTKQHHSHLEVTISNSSAGKYVCTCPEEGTEAKEPTPCQRAAYQLIVVRQEDECFIHRHNKKHLQAHGRQTVLAAYIMSFWGVLFLSACLMLFATRFRGAPRENNQIAGNTTSPEIQRQNTPNKLTITSSNSSTTPPSKDIFHWKAGYTKLTLPSESSPSKLLASRIGVDGMTERREEEVGEGGPVGLEASPSVFDLRSGEQGMTESREEEVNEGEPVTLKPTLPDLFEVKTGEQENTEKIKEEVAEDGQVTSKPSLPDLFEVKTGEQENTEIIEEEAREDGPVTSKPSLPDLFEMKTGEQENTEKEEVRQGEPDKELENC